MRELCNSIAGDRVSCVAMMSSIATVDEVCAHLDRDGFAIVTGVVDPDAVVALRRELDRLFDATPCGRNSFEGQRTRRVYALLAKTRLIDGPALHPLVLGVLDRLLGHYQFSATEAVRIEPGESAQALHTDDAVYPLARPHAELVINTMWAIDDFTEANGGTRLVRGSHQWTDRTPDATTATIAAEMPAGSLLLYRGSLWHGGGANRTDRPRVGVLLEYAASWLRQQENQLLAVPMQIVATLPERLRELIGYNVYPPFLGYVDGRHPRRVLDSSVQ
jgi:ectoine hydroxylase-related dioxygenase (phytanoyl-CoA dioxygenase family)